MNEIGTLNHPNNERLQRPTVITIICIMGFIGTALSIPMVFSEIASQIGPWFGPYAGTVALANVVCMVGLWQTKKWGLYAYTMLIILNQLVLITKGQWHVLTLVVQAIIVLIGLYHLHPDTKPAYRKVVLYLKRKAWAYTVAYMIGIHNPYREVEEDQDEIVYTIEDIDEQEDSAPKD